MQPTSGDRHRHIHARSAFTLVELLVVIAIIMLLIGILVYALNKALGTAGKAASQQFLQRIGMALTTYSNDFGAYPPSDYMEINAVGGPAFGVPNSTIDANWSGAEIMTQALVGPMPGTGSPNDGKAGFGFVSGGKAYGPYIDIKAEYNLFARWDKDGDSKLSADESWSSGNETADAYIFAEGHNDSRTPILYYRTGLTGNALGFDAAAANNRILSKGGRFDTDHNDRLDGDDVNGQSRVVDYWRNLATSSVVTEQETAANFARALRSGKFLLVSAGENQEFGIAGDDNNVGTADDVDYDDVTYVGP